MIKEICSKSILSTNRNPSSWFGSLYLMNVYRGCQHKCIYCDSRSECYGIENFDDVLVKINAVELLKKELPRKRKKGTIGTGAMTDPYTPAELQYKLTQDTLKVIADNNYPVHITTKSNLILRDVDIIKSINEIYASVAFTITTTDSTLAKKIEPYAPLPIERLKAMGILSTLGICTGITMMPILPFIEDNPENIVSIIEMAKDYGASFIYGHFGMTLRDRQKQYYFNKLDENFPYLRQKYEKKYITKYGCPANNAKKLKEIFYETCYKYGICTEAPTYTNKISSLQLDLLSNTNSSK